MGVERKRTVPFLENAANSSMGLNSDCPLTKRRLSLNRKSGGISMGMEEKRNGVLRIEVDFNWGESVCRGRKDSGASCYCFNDGNELAIEGFHVGE